MVSLARFLPFKYLMLMLVSSMMFVTASQAQTTADEARSIARLYSAAFDRLPKVGGLNFWVDSYEAGRPLHDIAADFSNSDEFRDKYGPLNDRAFIEQLFRNVLGREGAQGGINFWTGRLQDGRPRGEILAAFADSPENVVKTSSIYKDMQQNAQGDWVFIVGPTVTSLKASGDNFPELEIGLAGVNIDPDTKAKVFLKLGNSAEVEAPVSSKSTASKLLLKSAPGLLGGKDGFSSGDVGVRVVYTEDGQDRDLDAGSYGAQGLPPLPGGWPAGGASLLLLEAMKRLPLDAISNLGIANANALTGLNIGNSVTSANQFIGQINALEDIVSRAMSGESVPVSVNDPSVVFDQQSLKVLDTWSVALLQELTKIDVNASSVGGDDGEVLALAAGSGRKIYRANTLKVTPSVDDFLDGFDVQQLANEMADAWRENSEKVGQVVGVTAAVVALTASSPAVITAAGVVSAVGFFGTTAVGTAVGGILDGGSKAILNGKAEVEDFQKSAEFFAEQYFNLAVEKVSGAAAKDLFGETASQFTELGVQAVQVAETFLDEEVQPAFDNGSLPVDGIPDDAYSLSTFAYLADESTYYVVIETSPAVDAIVRLQVSGTDGYLYDEDVQVTGGFTEVSQPRGATGVVDTINVFSLGGRASAATQITFP